MFTGEDVAYVADSRRDTSSREVLRHEVAIYVIVMLIKKCTLLNH